MTVRALALVMTIFAAAPAWAAGGDDEESGPGRVAVAVFLLYEKELGRAAQANLGRGLEKALKKNERLAVKDKDNLLAEFAGEVPSEQISNARELKEQGEALLGENKPDDAIDKLASAEKALRRAVASFAASASSLATRISMAPLRRARASICAASSATAAA